ncbi:uncharacterized protein L199_004140 [Kwoniella botswanensis]|uniref:uncharacterized protein n=1 Tax=Kwoniella botswanensis TaxID=1268659 RepID=UPI00315CB2CC
MIVNPGPNDDLPSILHHAKPPPIAPPVPSSSLLKSESSISSGRKFLPELECMIIDELASSSLTNLRKKDVGDTAKLLLGPTPSYLDSRDELFKRRRMKRFKTICASIVYLRLRDERGGQALVFSLYYAGPSASSLLPNLRYLILGNRFISCSSFLSLPSEKKNDYGYKALWLISKNVNPEHVCMTMERKWISPARYRFGLQHLVWLFEYFDQVGSLTQQLDSGKKLVEVVYGKPGLRDRLQGFPTNSFTPINARMIASKEATQCVCCGKRQR